jgi:hypothetical protein
MSRRHVAISSLPVETLRNIFHLVVQGAEKNNETARLGLQEYGHTLLAHPSLQSLLLSHISQLWMMTARSYSRLWRNVHVENPGLAMLSLELSANQLLDVELRGSYHCYPERIGIDPHDREDEELYFEIDGIFADAIDMLLDHTARIRSLHIFNVPEDIRWWKWVYNEIEASNVHFPALEELFSMMTNICGWDAPIQLDVFLANPVGLYTLKKVYLTNSIISDITFEKLNLTSLVLSICNEDDSYDVNWKDALCGVSRTLEHLDMDAYLIENPGDTLIPFPSLKQLHLRSSVICAARLWKVMDAPMVSDVTLYEEPSNPTPTDIEAHKNVALGVNMRFRKVSDTDIDHFSLMVHLPDRIELSHPEGVFHLTLEFDTTDDNLIAFCHHLDPKLLAHITSLQLDFLGADNQQIFRHLIPLLPHAVYLDIDETTAAALFHTYASTLCSDDHHENSDFTFPSFRTIRLKKSRWNPLSSKEFSLKTNMRTVVSSLYLSKAPFWTLDLDPGVYRAHALCKAMRKLGVHVTVCEGGQHMNTDTKSDSTLSADSE